MHASTFKSVNRQLDMSKLAHICFTVIIYKQFNFCHFKASAYTSVDRLCAVFLHNVRITVGLGFVCLVVVEDVFI